LMNLHDTVGRWGGSCTDIDHATTCHDDDDRIMDMKTRKIEVDEM
jgi:hypothetical protein